MISGGRRRATLLLLIALAGGIGIGIGEWRRRHPELVDRLERFDHLDPGPAVAAPFRMRATAGVAPASAHTGPDGHRVDPDESADDRRDDDRTPALRRPPHRSEARVGRPVRSSSGASRPPVRAPLDLNRASAEALAELPGVGPGLANTIVAARETRGPFASVDDLRWVRGIGPGRLERLRPFVTVTP